MVKALSNQDLPRKKQRPPQRTSPECLTLQEIPVPGSPFLNLSNSPTSSTAISNAQGLSSWEDQHVEDDYEMEHAEYGPGNKDLTPLPRVV
jgi:hypothetical protein